MAERAGPELVPSRHPERFRDDRAEAYRLLDETLHCHLGFVVGGRPMVLPTLHARVGDRLYLHGSTGSRPLLTASRAGRLAVAVAVTRVDAVVLAKAAFNHSVNYRSMVVHAVATPVDDPAAKRAALDAIVEHVCPGRTADARAGNPKELAATAVLEVPLDSYTFKQRSGPPADEPADLDLPVWSGLVPFSVGVADPVPAAGAPLPAPGYLGAVRLP